MPIKTELKVRIYSLLDMSRSRFKLWPGISNNISKLHRNVRLSHNLQLGWSGIGLQVWRTVLILGATESRMKQQVRWFWKLLYWLNSQMLNLANDLYIVIATIVTDNAANGCDDLMIGVMECNMQQVYQWEQTRRRRNRMLQECYKNQELTRFSSLFKPGQSAIRM